jgi:predicted nucleic acid-binding Zn ribbon protein
MNRNLVLGMIGKNSEESARHVEENEKRNQNIKRNVDKDKENRYKDPEYREKYNEKRKEKLWKTSPKENYMLRGYHGRFLPGNRINLGRNYFGRIYPEKDCIICGVKFRPINGIQETCNKECKRELKRNYENSKNRREKVNAASRILVQNIQQRWSPKGKQHWLKDTWRIAEEKAPDILRNEGYENIESWSTNSQRFPFDVSAFKDGREYVFQVTTNVTTKKEVAQRFATRYGLCHKVLYISVETNRYIIKDFPKCGAGKISSRDESNALVFV